MIMFGCVQNLPSKISFFPVPKIFESWRRIVTKMKENETRKMVPGFGPEKFCDWHRKDFSNPALWNSEFKY